MTHLAGRPLAARRASGAVLVSLLASGCAHHAGKPVPAGPPPAAPPQGWQTTLWRDHPLVGRIWDVAGQRFVTPETFVGALVPARYATLGEKHDNPDAHALQRWTLAQMLAAGRKPAVVFEQLKRDQQPVLDDWVAQHPRSAAGLGEALAWDQGGWPSWSYYEPIFQLALENGLPILAGDLSKADLEKLRKGELEGVDAADRRRLGLDLPPTEAQRASLVQELKDSHCGYGNDAMFARMVVVQWARDSELAWAMTQGASHADGAVLIAGAGHARDDRGVPFHLQRLEPGTAVRSVSFMEVVHEADAPADYRDQDEARLPFDFVWFTPRVDENDPCAQFRTKTP